MPEFPTTSAEAAPQAAGYIFQLRYALHRALKRIPRDPTGSIAIECVDDIAGSTNQELSEITQLKHTTKANTTFNDLSPEIWRTLGNWARFGTSSPDLNLASLELVFVTNAKVDANCGLSYLLGDESTRDPAKALAALLLAATTSENNKTNKDRADFLALDPAVQVALIRAVRITANHPGLAALGSEIEDLLHYACEQASLTAFREELEGWWLDRISVAFAEGAGAIVPLLQLDARISYLREKYKTSALTIDVDGPTEANDLLDTYIFVKQLRSVEASFQRVRNAQRDFLKASAQRSKWLREARIDPAELDKYDRTLEERWGARSEIIWNELDGACTAPEKCKAGRDLLGWAETQETPLRGASAQFLTSGSYHTLADRLRLGWHPDFKTLFGG